MSTGVYVKGGVCLSKVGILRENESRIQGTCVGWPLVTRIGFSEFCAQGV